MASLPADLENKWEQVATEVEQLCGMGLPPLRFVAVPRHACYPEGLGKSRLVISEDVLRELELDELVGAVAHELAHLCRGDLWWGTFAFLCYCLLFFVPVGHRCYGGYLAARERAADDWAITHTGRPLALASALGKVRRLAEPDVPGSQGGQLLVGRLQRLLTGHTQRGSHAGTGAVGLTLVLMAIAFPILLPTIANLHHKLEPLGRSVLMALGIVS